MDSWKIYTKRGEKISGKLELTQRFIPKNLKKIFLTKCL